MVAVLRYAPAWRGVVPLLRGGDAGMDSSATSFAAAVAFGAERGVAAPFDILSGEVRLPRRRFPLDGPGQLEPLRADLAAAIQATGRRVTARAASAGASAEAASARSGPQGAEARRLADASPPLDESFGVIASRRDAQRPAAPHALLLNRQLGEGAAAAEEEEAEGRMADVGWAHGRGLAAMAGEEPAGAAAWAAEAEERPEEAGAVEAAAAAAAAAAERAVRREWPAAPPTTPCWLAWAVLDDSAASRRAAMEAAAAAAAAAAREEVEAAAARRAMRVADPEEAWEEMEAAREAGWTPQQPGEAEDEAEALEQLLRRLRTRVGVRRMPRLSESEGCARGGVAGPCGGA